MHAFARHRHTNAGAVSENETQGRILNLGWGYDLMVWFFDTFVVRGKLRQLRQRTADLAGIQRGEQVLDVGCGTGTLALEVQQRVGASGRVVGVDPGSQQIARARAKAARRHIPIEFRSGVIEQLPFPDQTFDVVLSTLMLHHVPNDLKRRGLAEIARVLKPGGRLVIADFARPEDGESQPARRGIGASRMRDLVAFVQDAGFSQVETEEIQFPRFLGHPRAGGFVRALKR